MASDRGRLREWTNRAGQTGEFTEDEIAAARALIKAEDAVAAVWERLGAEDAIDAVVASASRVVKAAEGRVRRAVQVHIDRGVRIEAAKAFLRAEPDGRNPAAGAGG